MSGNIAVCDISGSNTITISQLSDYTPAQDAYVVDICNDTNAIVTYTNPNNVMQYMLTEASTVPTGMAPALLISDITKNLTNYLIQKMNGSTTKIYNITSSISTFTDMINIDNTLGVNALNTTSSTTLGATLSSILGTSQYNSLYPVTASGVTTYMHPQSILGNACSALFQNTNGQTALLDMLISTGIATLASGTQGDPTATYHVDATFGGSSNPAINRVFFIKINIDKNSQNSYGFYLMFRTYAP